MKIRTAVVTASILCILVACSNASKDYDNLKRTVNESPAGVDRSVGEIGNFNTDSTTQDIADDKKQEKKEPGNPDPILKQDWDKKIIKNASLNIEVKDYSVFYSSMRDKVRNLGGYIAQEEQSQTDYKIENTLVIKVPVDQFDNALSQLSSNVEKINERKVTSQDVTSEYIDTKSRIEAKKQVRFRYMDLLKQAKNMEEILSVQSEINGIQEEIESATGRIEYLGHSSAFSTINLTYYQVLNSSAKTNDAPPSLGTKILTAFKTGLSWIVDLIIALVSIWPLWILVFVLVVLYRRSKFAKNNPAA